MNMAFRLLKTAVSVFLAKLISKAGTVGETGAFTSSFEKLNVWGDGGVILLIVLNNRSLKLLRNHGLSNRDSVEVLGCNSRLTPFMRLLAITLLIKFTLLHHRELKMLNT